MSDAWFNATLQELNEKTSALEAICERMSKLSNDDITGDGWRSLELERIAASRARQDAFRRCYEMAYPLGPNNKKTPTGKS